MKGIPVSCTVLVGDKLEGLSVADPRALPDKRVAQGFGLRFGL